MTTCKRNAARQAYQVCDLLRVNGFEAFVNSDHSVSTFVGTDEDCHLETIIDLPDAVAVIDHCQPMLGSL